MLKSRVITDKYPNSQSYGFSRSHVWSWEMGHKNWVPNQQGLRRVLRVLWTAKKTNNLIMKEIKKIKERKKSTGTLCGGIDAEIEEPIVWPIWGQVPNHCERPLAEKDLVQEEKGTKEDSSVQSFSHVQLLATPWTATHQASLPFTNSQNWFKLMSIESVMPSNHLILCCPLLLPLWIFPSIRVFSNESVLCIRWPKYWTFSFYVNPSNEYSGLISFRMDWLDPLAVQRTLKSLLQHHSSKASILRCSAFFIVQLSHAHMTTGKTIALTKWTFVDWLLEEEACHEKKQSILNKGKSLTKNQKH